MSNRKVISIVVVAVVLAFLIGAAILVKNRSGSGENNSGSNGGTAPETEGRVVTRETLPGNIVVGVPDKDTKNVPENVAIPETVAPGNSAGTTDYRSFDIKAENDKFIRDTINVYQGDTININITAVDKDYDFTQPDYGFAVSISKGTTKRIQFGASAGGRFLFYCESCGGPKSGPQGQIVVASR